MKALSGKVVSKKMAKTATVLVTRFVAHPVYKKRVKRDRLYQVHDEEEKTRVGDTVSFVSSRPMSKTKKWRIV